MVLRAQIVVSSQLSGHWGEGVLLVPAGPTLFGASQQGDSQVTSPRQASLRLRGVVLPQILNDCRSFYPGH